MATMSLLALACCTATGLGPYKPFLALVEICFLLYCLTSLFNTKSIPKIVLCMLLIPGMFFALDHFINDMLHHRESERNLFAFMAIAGLIPFLTSPGNFNTPLRNMILFLVTATSLIHSFAIFFFKLPFGLLDNPHFTSLFTVIVFILAVYYCLTASKTFELWIAYFLILNSLLLLFYFSSWVGLSSLIGSVILVIILKNNYHSYITALCLLFFLSVVLLSVDFSQSGNNEIENILGLNSYPITDERLVLWGDSWQMQLDSSLQNWIFGHGFGGFRENFSEYSRFSNTIEFVFPHNFLLEVLYNNGLLGVLGLLAAFTGLIIKLQKDFRSSQDILNILAIMLVTSLFLFGFLTLPLLSKYNSYSLAFVIGFSLWILKRGSSTNEY